MCYNNITNAHIHIFIFTDAKYQKDTSQKKNRNRKRNENHSTHNYHINNGSRQCYDSSTISTNTTLLLLLAYLQTILQSPVLCTFYLIVSSCHQNLKFAVKCLGDIIPTIAPCSEISNVEHYAMNVILINKILDFILLVIHYFIGD